MDRVESPHALNIVIDHLFDRSPHWAYSDYEIEVEKLAGSGPSSRPEPAQQNTVALWCDSLACGERPLQGTDECPEASHRPFQIHGVSVDALVLDGQGVRQVAILLLHCCKLQLGGLQLLTDLSFCSHVLSLAW